jgi:hypothetical protein
MSGKRVSPKMFESFVSLDVVGLTLTVLRASVWMFFCLTLLEFFSCVLGHTTYMFMYNIYMVNPYIKKQQQNSDRIE